jgi:beta-lactamase superfamily II metal-dependent hydrolase
MSEAMKPTKHGAVVRMYCAGFGDCFLLAFTGRVGKPVYVWIDCGALPHDSMPGGAKTWFTRILESIQRTVGDQGVRLLVVTHKHSDHLSGFYDAQDVFKKIDVREIWMPWTDDPGDRTALRLAARERDLLRVAQKAADHFGQARRRDDAHLASMTAGLDSLLQFSGSLAAVGVPTDSLQKTVQDKRTPQYLKASLTPRTLDGAPGLRIHVLGPPEAGKLLKKMDPSGGEKREVYLSGLALNSTLALDVAMGLDDPASAIDQDREVAELSFPFASDLQRPAEKIHQPESGAETRRSLLRELLKTFGGESTDPRSSWRSIDFDWLRPAVAMALKADGFRNNTSLALAFELGEGGPVLLFPGDAQVGNWLSWHERKDGNGPTARDLLDRTVLYKAGHHGSENATLKQLGLELMAQHASVSRGKLVALVPTSREVAQSKLSKKDPDGWDIPWAALMRRLKELAGGRVMRIDDAGKWDKWLKQSTPPAGVDPEGWKWFRKRSRVGWANVAGKDVPLYVEVNVPGKS